VAVYPVGDGRSWVVQSATEPSLLYHVYRFLPLEEPTSRRWVDALCTCLAGQDRKKCWHIALVAIERGDTK
jgi:hypothetical protein